MKFVIALVSYLESLGYDTSSLRKSADGSKAIVHMQYAEILSKNLDTNANVTIYDRVNPDFQALLASDEWNGNVTGTPNSFGDLAELAKYEARLTAQVTEAKTDMDNFQTEIAGEVTSAKEDLNAIVDNYQVTVNQQLADIDLDKVDKNGSGQVGWANIAQDARLQIIGTTPPAVVGDNSVITSNLTDNAVTPKKANFFDSRINLFDKTTVTADKIANPAWGGLDTVAGYSASAFIPAAATIGHMFNKPAYVSFYDSANAYLSGLTDPTPTPAFTVITPPLNCAYVRLSPLTSNLDTFMFVKGVIDADFKYIPYNFAHISEVVLDKVDAEVLLKKSSVSKILCDFAIPSRNLFNKDTVTLNKLTYPYNDANKGLLVDDANGDASAFIPVDPLDNYLKNTLGSLVIYDSNQNYITGYDNSVAIPNHVFTMPANAAYVRFTIPHTSALSAVQFEKGSVPTDLQPYGAYYLDDTFVLPQSTGGDVGDIYAKYHTLTWLTFGDSHTEQQSYQSWVNAKLAFGYTHKQGLGGSCIANAGTVASFVERYLALPTDWDIMTIYGGSNDHGQNVPLDNAGNPLDNTTLKGALREILEYFSLTYPDRQIFVMTPCNSYVASLAGNGYKNALGLMVRDYAQAIREVCNEYGVTVIDLNAKSGINLKNQATLLEDTVHLTDTANKTRVAPLIISAFEECIY